MIKCIFVAGARPNFMKIAPILREAKKYDNFETLLVHTGQHYDHNMSQSFFEDLGIKKPEYHLGCRGGSHAEQTANIMVEFEKLCLDVKPDFVLVVGDVNSTIAAGLVAKKLKVKLIHVEAGLRSGDRDMPEEINRLATDAITDVFFTTEKNGTQNLLDEGHLQNKVHFVGHVMIDNLYYQIERLKDYRPLELVSKMKRALPEKYFCMTMHRPSNVDNKDTLVKLLRALKEISEKTPIVFPCHPRTKKKIEHFGLDDLFEVYYGQDKIEKGIILTDPLGYNDFLYIWKNCIGMLTDSGGLQEETTALNIPCLTMRENTERPITVEIGTNVLIGFDTNLMKREAGNILNGNFKKGKIPELWDGKASERIISVVIN
jgi:UDP-N-acetylglucosamine 2-epimerase (non-hydrolysing)